MGLELRKNSSYWYGRFEVHGRKRTLSLGVKVEGVRPAHPGERGDEAFEASRAKARLAFDRWLSTAQEKGGAERLVQSLLELRSGVEVEEVPIRGLFDMWLNLPRPSPVSEGHRKNVKAVFDRFVGFIEKTTPQCRFASMVTPKTAEAFMSAEGARGVSGKTFNAALGVLRQTFASLGPEALVANNPFSRIPERRTATISRAALTPAQVRRLLAASPRHAFIRRLMITGLCTAMRRGDCCQLRWVDVDLSARTVRVKTRKTGRTVVVPIFPLLEQELRAALPPGAAAPTDGFVFPDLEIMYQTNPDGITWRFGQLLKDAGFAVEEARDASTNVDAIRQSRPDGVRAASVRGFHCLRTTWVTLALTANVPIEVVRLVTGHRTVEVVLENYFQPNAAQYRTLLEERLPSVLTGSQRLALCEPQSEDMATWVNGKLALMTPLNWAMIRDEIATRLKETRGEPKPARDAV